jgi:hypothetical protein
MMKRREFIKTIGIGAAGVTSLSGLPALPASSSTVTAGARIPALQTFHFESVTVDQRGRQIALHQHQGRFFRQLLGDHSDLEMVLIPDDITARSSFMGKYPVTQAQWRIVAGWPRVNRDLDPDPAYFKAAEHPVECVSWLDAHEFCHRLSAHSGLHYRLPEQAHWEYACRAGTRTPFHCGPTITSELANYGSTHTYAAETGGAYRRSTTPAGHFLPNAFGLHDMHGNVWEWCADAVNAGVRNLRALRGGAWPDKPDKLSSAYRSVYHEDALNRIIGFRVSCSV